MYESLSKVEQVSIPAIYLGMEIIALVCVVGVLPQVKKVMTASDLPLSTCSGARVIWGGYGGACVLTLTHTHWASY